MATRATIDFGIDLGIANSAIAVVDGVDVKVIPNKVGATLTPCAVWVNPRGELYVGQEAKARILGGDNSNGDMEFKLRMGLGDAGKKVFERSGREMRPEDLSAEILKSLRADVRCSMGEDIRSAVITVPAGFDLVQTNATARAARLAGFVSAPLLLEPVAASLAYGFQSESVGENAYWLVYDFGSGTFDAALMRVRDGLIQVVNHNCDNYLGGKLIDGDLVTKFLVPALDKRYKLPGFGRGNDRWTGAMGRLMYAVGEAKIEVCRTRRELEVYLEYLCDDADGNPVEVVYTLTPEIVEQASRPYIERSLGLCRRTLEEKGLKGSSLDGILMIGGSTLSPWVRDAVAADLGAPLEIGMDPVTVVAQGAAIFASTQPVPINPTATVPLSCAHSIGIGLADGNVFCLIRKGSFLPGKGAVDWRTTIPLRAGNPEDRVRISVVEGDNPRGERNHLIGDLIIKGTDFHRDLPMGSAVEITLDMDASMRVQVMAFVPLLNEEFQVEFDLKTR